MINYFYHTEKSLELAQNIIALYELLAKELERDRQPEGAKHVREIAECNLEFLELDQCRQCEQLFKTGDVNEDVCDACAAKCKEIERSDRESFEIYRRR